MDPLRHHTFRTISRAFGHMDHSLKLLPFSSLIYSPYRGNSQVRAILQTCPDTNDGSVCLDAKSNGIKDDKFNEVDDEKCLNR